MAVTHVNDITGRIIGAAIEVHRVLGPGLMESTYEGCLAEEMALRKLRFSRQHHFPVLYKNRVIRSRYRLDFLVEDRVIVEIKSVERFDPIHTAQMLTYLNLTGCYLGLLLNFNVRAMKGGIRRVVRGHPVALTPPPLPRE